MNFLLGMRNVDRSLSICCPFKYLENANELFRLYERMNEPKEKNKISTELMYRLLLTLDYDWLKVHMY